MTATLLRKIYREKVAILGGLTTLLGALVSAAVITERVGGVIIAVVGLAFILLRAVLTPSEEVVVQRKPQALTAVAGPASSIADGTPVVVRPLHDPPIAV